MGISFWALVRFHFKLLQLVVSSLVSLLSNGKLES